jgi:putative phage-type endonuclease
MSAVANSYNGLTREAWLAERKNYLGATDIAAVIGKHKYKTAVDVYLEKVGQKPEAGTSRKAEAGLALEPLVREWYAKEIGQKISAGRTVFDPEHPFLAVNLDGEAEDGDPVEIKTMDFATRDEWGTPGTDEIPSQYYIQAIVQLGTLGRNRCRVVKCDRGTMEIEEYIVLPDPENFKLCRAMGVVFWTKCVLPKIPPSPTDRDGDNIIHLFPRETGEILIADESIDNLAAEMKEVYPEYKRLEKSYEALKSQMKVAIGQASGIETLIGRFLLPRCKGRTSWKDVAMAMKADPGTIAAHCGEPYTQLKTPF